MKYVYVITNGLGYYKVGVAQDVIKRMNALQTSNPDKIELVASRLVREPTQVEAAIHNFVKYNRADGGTEWFRLQDAEVLAVVKMLARQPEVQLMSKEYIINLFMSEMQTERRQILSRLSTIESKLGTKFVQVKESAGQKQHARKLRMDEYENRALEYFQRSGKVSASSLQRRYSIGYAKAARIVDALEEKGFVSAPNGNSSKGRELIN